VGVKGWWAKRVESDEEECCSYATYGVVNSFDGITMVFYPNVARTMTGIV